MYTNILLTVFLIWTIAAMTPGPNFFITVHTAVGETRRLTLFTILGIVTGTLMWAISGYLGVTIIFKTVPILYYSIKILGGIYLIYIGISLLVRKRSDWMTKKEKRDLSPINRFKLGLFTNLLNPKTAAFITSLFAATIPPHAPLQLGILCIILICFISAFWYSLVAVVFSFKWAKRAYVTYQHGMEKVAGGIFILFGLKLATSK